MIKMFMLQYYIINNNIIRILFNINNDHIYLYIITDIGMKFDYIN